VIADELPPQLILTDLQEEWLNKAVEEVLTSYTWIRTNGALPLYGDQRVFSVRSIKGYIEFIRRFCNIHEEVDLTFHQTLGQWRNRINEYVRHSVTMHKYAANRGTNGELIVAVLLLGGGYKITDRGIAVKGERELVALTANKYFMAKKPARKSRWWQLCTKTGAPVVCFVTKEWTSRAQALHHARSIFPRDAWGFRTLVPTAPELYLP
jgi:hypothetical protein